MKATLEIDGRTKVGTEIIKDRLGLSDGAVNNWIRLGWLPAPVKIGRQNYFDLLEFEAVLSTGTKKSPHDGKQKS